MIDLHRGAIPELEILVRQSDRELAYEVTAADPDLGLHHKPMGKIVLRRDSKGYFDEFFEVVSKSDMFAAGLSQRDHEDEKLRGMGLRFFDELFPRPLQALLWSLRHRVASLLILSEDPWIPWELCCLQGEEGGSYTEGSFFCEAFDMTRWLGGKAYFTRFAMERLALLERGATPLPGAERERGALVALFNAHGQVHTIPARLRDLTAAMTAGGFDAWHLSGHGAHHEKTPFVCLSLQDDAILTPDNISGKKRNLGLNHPLVFMNCCYSGRAGLSLTGISGWAHKLIDIGAGAFVGTQWAVDDEAAYRFSHAFYTFFLEGCPLGEAVRRARVQIRRMGEATWLAFTVFGHPLARVQSRAKGRTQIANRSMPKRPPVDFAHFITVKTRAYSGRDNFFQSVLDFSGENSCGYLHLTAAAGWGKTAFIGALAKRHPNNIAYFNNRLAGLWKQSDFTEFLEAIVCERQGRHHAAIAGTIEGCLRALARDVPTFIFIDAVDEAEPPAAGNLLGLPVEVPQGVFIVLASRSERIALTTRSPLKHLRLDTDDQQHRLDLRQYLEKRFQEEKISLYLKRNQLVPAKFITILIEKSDASFVYVTSFLEQIENGNGLNPKVLPQGLGGFFQASWQARRHRAGAAWLTCVVPIISVLAVLMEAAPTAAIATFTNIPESRVLSVLGQWIPFLYLEPGAAGETCRYRIDHATFQAFLEQKDRRSEGGVDLSGARLRIAETLHRHLTGQ